MNTFIELNDLDLNDINGGKISKTDVAAGIIGCICPAFGVFWTIKTASDWLAEQNW